MASALHTIVLPIVIAAALALPVVYYLAHYRSNRTINCVLSAPAAALYASLARYLPPLASAPNPRAAAASASLAASLPPAMLNDVSSAAVSYLRTRAALVVLGGSLVVLAVVNAVIVSAAASSSTSAPLAPAPLPWWIGALSVGGPLVVGALLLTHAAVTVSPASLVAAACYLLMAFALLVYLFSCYASPSPCLPPDDPDFDSSPAIASVTAFLLLATAIPCSLIGLGACASWRYSAAGAPTLALLQPTTPSASLSASPPYSYSYDYLYSYSSDSS